MKKISYLLIFALAAIISSCSGDIRKKMLDQVPDNSSVIVTVDLKKCASAMGMEYDKGKGTLTFNKQMTDAFQAFGISGYIDDFENEFNIKGIEPSYCVVFDENVILEVSDKDALLKSLKDIYQDSEVEQIGDYVVVGRESSFDNPVYLISGKMAYMVYAKDTKDAARKLDKIKSSVENHPIAEWKKDILLDDKTANYTAVYNVPLVSGNARFIAGNLEIDGNELTIQANPYDKDGKKTNFTEEVKLNILNGSELKNLPKSSQIVMAGSMPSGVVDNPVVEENIKKALSYSYDEATCNKIMSTLKGFKSAAMGFGRKEGANPMNLAPNTWCGALDVYFDTPQQASDATSLFRTIIEKEEQRTREMYESYGIDYAPAMVFEGTESVYSMSMGRELKDLKLDFSTNGNMASASYNSKGSATGYEQGITPNTTFYAAAIIPVDSPLGKTLMLDWDLEVVYALMPDGMNFKLKLSATEGCLAGNILDWVAKLFKNAGKYDVSHYMSSGSEAAAVAVEEEVVEEI